MTPLQNSYNSIQSILSYRSKEPDQQNKDSSSEKGSGFLLRNKNLNHSPIFRKRKKGKINFILRQQQINDEAFQKWMKDETAKNKCDKFHRSLMIFLKEFPQKLIQKLLKLIEFKSYLKPIFFSDQTSIIQLHKELDFQQIFRRAFSYQLYEEFLNSRYSHQQIQQFKQAQQEMKDSQTTKINQEMGNPFVKFAIPLYNDFVQDILLVDLLILGDQLDEMVIQRQTEAIDITGQQLQLRKAHMHYLEKQSIKKQQNKQLSKCQNPNKVNRPIDHLTSFQGLANCSLMENLNKIELNYGQLNLISDSTKALYSKLQTVMKKLNQQKNELIGDYN